MVGWRARDRQRPCPFKQTVAFQHLLRRNEENHDKFEICSVDSGEGLVCDISGWNDLVLWDAVYVTDEHRANSFGM